jgi:hypothetical protein
MFGKAMMGAGAAGKAMGETMGNKGGMMRGRERAMARRAQRGGASGGIFGGAQPRPGDAMVQGYADGGYVCGHASGLHGKNMKKGGK